MFTMPLAEMKQKIAEKGNISSAEVDKRIKEKLSQLSGLISAEGAAHIVANELGISLLDTANLKIKNIAAGMRNVDISGKILQVYELREFNTGARQGKVANFLIGDETGTMRIVMWNDQAENIKKLNKGDVVKIKSGYIRENNARLELHMNDVSKLIINPEGVSIQTKEFVPKQTAIRKKISELTDQDQNVELLATVVQVYDPRFFEVCPNCNKRVKNDGAGFSCLTHGFVEPTFSYLLNLFLDDGSSNMRSVFFRDQALQLLNINHQDMLALNNPGAFEAKKNDLLGMMVKVVGKVNKNQTFDRTEFVAQQVFLDPNPEQEMEKLPVTETPKKPKGDDELYSLEELEEAIE
jgi:replication factor A1